jgi:hypothetical protein
MQQPDGGSGLLGRQPAVGNWVFDAGLGIAGGVLATINEALILGVTELALGSGESGCSAVHNIILCTSPELFFGGASGELAGIPAVIGQLWPAMESVAIGLIGLLFVVRIGRMVAEGPGSLATEGKSLVISFALALAWVSGAEGILRMILGMLNELHALVAGDALRDLMERAFLPGASLNLGGQLTLLVLVVTALILAGKAVLRLVHLTILISVAPLMGALLIDRTTSARFGRWFGALVEVLLQQTAWVFFFRIGVELFEQSGPGAGGTEQIVANLMAAMVFGMAVGGERVLAGIAGATGGPGGMVGSALGSALSGRSVLRAGRAVHQAQLKTGKSFAEAAAGLAGRTSGGTASGDPLQSAAAQRASGDMPAAPSQAGTSRKSLSASLSQSSVSNTALRSMLGAQRDQLSPNAVAQAKALTQLRSLPPSRGLGEMERRKVLHARSSLKARLFELRAQELDDPAQRQRLNERARRYAEIAQKRKEQGARR